jgi:hypothetical protein
MARVGQRGRAGIERSAAKWDGMRRHLVLAGAAAGLLSLALPSSAAPKPQLTDLVGDANGVNGQATGAPVPGVATAPADLAGADIVSVTMATVWKRIGSRKVPNGFSITMQLAGAPAELTTYNVSANVPGTCDGSNTQLTIGTWRNPAVEDHFANCGDPEDPTGASTDVEADYAEDAAKHTITWTIAKGMKKGDKVVGLTASSSVFVLGVFDEASGAKPFTYGS